MTCEHYVITIKREGRKQPLMICVRCLKVKPKSHGLTDSHIAKLAAIGAHTAVKYEVTNGNEANTTGH